MANSLRFRGGYRLNKAASILFTLITAFLLVACNNSHYENEPLEEGNIGYDVSSKKWIGTGGCFAFKLKEDSGCVVSTTEFDGNVYYLKSFPQKESVIELNGKKVYSSENFVSAICASQDGVWIAESSFSNQTIKNQIKCVSISGQVLETINTESIGLDNTYIRLLRYLDEKLYAIYDNNLLVLDEKGEILFLKKTNLKAPYLVKGGDENIYIVETTAKNKIFRIDAQAKDLIHEYTCIGEPLHDGDSKYFLLLTTEKGLYGIGYNGDIEPIMLCKECNISFSGLTQIKPNGKGNYICCISGNIFDLIQVLPEEVKQKELLTIATIGNLSTLTNVITSYNYNSNSYYIDVVDYSSAGMLSRKDALAKLNTEIISGKSPDMICFSNISPFHFIRNGLLTDIKSFITQDDSIDINSIAIINALENDGKIYLIDNKFCIETLIGKNAIFGDTDGWTFSDYLKLEKGLPPEAQMIYNMTKETFLFYASSRYLRYAINWETGECKFNNNEFVALLEASDRILETPENITDRHFFEAPVEIANGRMIAASVFLTNVWKLAEIEEKAGCPLSYIGWPSVDGNNGSDIWLLEPLGIMSTSTRKAGCWDFIKYMLQYSNSTGYDGVLSEYGLPVYLPVLASRIIANQKSKECPVEITDDYIERLMHLIYGIENIAMYEQTVLDIIQKESEKYFAGITTAKKTAEIIESKINIFLAEQYG